MTNKIKLCRNDHKNEKYANHPCLPSVYRSDIALVPDTVCDARSTTGSTVRMPIGVGRGYVVLVLVLVTWYSDYEKKRHKNENKYHHLFAGALRHFSTGPL
jgi:hypothetical protein